MAKGIKTIHDRINLALSKETGKYYSPEKIDNEVWAESLKLFKKYYKVFEETQEVSSYLEPFMIISPELSRQGNGLFNKPTDMQHPTMIVSPGGLPIEIVDRAAWPLRVKDPVFGPSVEFPICRVDKSTIELLPTSITKIVMHYLKAPAKPVFSYTRNGTKYEYQDGPSVDVEWSPIIFDEIVNGVLGNLGIGMRDGSVVQFAAQEKAMENR